MYDTRNLEKRSEKCLTCHLGTADKFVDHEMIAAGGGGDDFAAGQESSGGDCRRGCGLVCTFLCTTLFSTC
jgi:hypothetical protein